MKTVEQEGIDQIFAMITATEEEEWMNEWMNEEKHTKNEILIFTGSTGNLPGCFLQGLLWHVPVTPLPFPFPLRNHPLLCVSAFLLI